MPYAASLIASAFVRKGITAQQFVTQMKLQKMVYFAHGYHLAKYEEPLIDEIFEAWKFGPVVQSIYQEYKFYGNSMITDIPDPKLERRLFNLNETAEDAINFTWEATKGVSGTVLSNWTHKEGSPWAISYMPDTWSIPIGNDKIKEYFTNFLNKDGND